MAGQLLGHTEPRVRQMSGNMSDHSHNSILKERMVCISHNKVPFSKSNKVATSYY